MNEFFNNEDFLNLFSKMVILNVIPYKISANEEEIYNDFEGINHSLYYENIHQLESIAFLDKILTLLTGTHIDEVISTEDIESTGFQCNYDYRLLINCRIKLSKEPDIHMIADKISSNIKYYQENARHILAHDYLQAKMRYNTAKNSLGYFDDIGNPEEDEENLLKEFYISYVRIYSEMFPFLWNLEIEDISYDDGYLYLSFLRNEGYSSTYHPQNPHLFKEFAEDDDDFLL